MEKSALQNFELYQKSRELSRLAWAIYQRLPREIRYRIGGQFLDATDSIQANISEGFGRYHFRDKINFHYIARGSLYESISWSELILEREMVEPGSHQNFSILGNEISRMNNAYIKYLRSQLEKGLK